MWNLALVNRRWFTLVTMAIGSAGDELEYMPHDTLGNILRGTPSQWSLFKHIRYIDLNMIEKSKFEPTSLFEDDTPSSTTSSSPLYDDDEMYDSEEERQRRELDVQDQLENGNYDSSLMNETEEDEYVAERRIWWRRDEPEEMRVYLPITNVDEGAKDEQEYWTRKLVDQRKIFRYPNLKKFYRQWRKEVGMEEEQEAVTVATNNIQSISFRLNCINKRSSMMDILSLPYFANLSTISVNGECWYISTKWITRLKHLRHLELDSSFDFYSLQEGFLYGRFDKLWNRIVSISNQLITLDTSIGGECLTLKDRAIGSLFQSQSLTNLWIGGRYGHTDEFWRAFSHLEGHNGLSRLAEPHSSLVALKANQTLTSLDIMIPGIFNDDAKLQYTQLFFNALLANQSITHLGLYNDVNFGTILEGLINRSNITIQSLKLRMDEVNYQLTDQLFKFIGSNVQTVHKLKIIPFPEPDNADDEVVATTIINSFANNTSLMSLDLDLDDWQLDKVAKGLLASSSKGGRLRSLTTYRCTITDEVMSLINSIPSLELHYNES
ncbi:hypothetical protein SAMD00019534_110730 [Acytostelium subglobosum LB1]|uniref:hypothetical protein n=1 Tax=Acytostelium subglobosum LB1 TaxID=1410327 RepID=UPI0006451193|nr:hypothetical protein SAMD00019534_110730 [Acytostelium subglobosum LB1]GAM27897.1 hypothetical protein SAMD00019534_110730 [Acytostelium subglobosum LB1]|eukprot:XP_012749180.1 hypothetical protein SAMD00019534_110730 [Acytostelium subglobosum LB1]